MTSRPGVETCPRRDGDQRPKVGLVAVKRLGAALLWLIAALDASEFKLQSRVMWLKEKPPEQGDRHGADRRSVRALVPLAHTQGEGLKGTVGSFEADKVTSNRRLLFRSIDVDCGVLGSRAMTALVPSNGGDFIWGTATARRPLHAFGKGAQPILAAFALWGGPEATTSPPSPRSASVAILLDPHLGQGQEGQPWRHRPSSRKQGDPGTQRFHETTGSG